MIVEPIIQQISLIISLVLGAFLGFVYDIVRAFRLCSPTWLSWFLDFFYCLFVMVCLFSFAPCFSNGYIRFVILICCGLGFALYYCLLSRFVRTLAQWIGRAIGFLISLFLRPFFLLWQSISKPLRIFSNYLKKTIKKIFSFQFRWFTMSKMPKNTKSVTEQSQEEVWHDQSQKGWFLD